LIEVRSGEIGGIRIKAASRDRSARIQSGVTRLGGGALKSPIQLTRHQLVGGRHAAREEGEKVRI